MNKAILELEGFILDVNLGVTGEERANTQEIAVSVKLQYKTPPLACSSDSIGGAVCYDKLTDFIQQSCKNREFKLLEHMTQCLYNEMVGLLGEGIDIIVTIEKLNPPMKKKIGAVKFTLAGF